MGKKIGFLGKNVWLLIMVIAMFLGSCRDPNNGNEIKGKDFDIAGTYSYTADGIVYSWVFSASGSHEITKDGTSTATGAGTWTVSGNEITIKLTKSVSVTEVFTISESSNQITLTIKGTSVSTIFVIFDVVGDSLTLTSENCSISWNLNQGAFDPGSYHPTKIVKGTVLAKPTPDPTRALYTFEGWYRNSSFTQEYLFNAPVTENLDLYAKWNEYCSISWNLNNGAFAPDSNHPTQIVKSTILAKPTPDPTRAFSTFVGWYRNSSFTQEYLFNTPVTANLDLYAKWNVDPFDSITGFDNKLEWLKNNAQSNTSYALELNADETITSKAFGGSNSENTTITLTGVGGEKIISRSGIGYLFYIGSGITLVLDTNITLQGNSDNSSSLVQVRHGTLIMNTGSKITGNSYTRELGFNPNETRLGGGVNVTSGTFTMNGGEISGNTASHGGGGVYIHDLLYTGKPVFTMNGGKISGNTGGGVLCLNGGTFTMNGGEISGNTASSGGGVNVQGTGIFTMNGGVISGNTGGGVALRSRGTFHIITGIIYGSSSGDLSNTNGGSSIGAALYCDTSYSYEAQHGIFNGTIWASVGDLSSTDSTIHVIDGVLQ